MKVSAEVHFLYAEISKLAHSERVTTIYIHYLNDIENDEKLYDQIYENLKRTKNLEDKIVIEDWNNSADPILIVSVEEDRFGTMIDLNTTCATLLGH